jgi:hypothetical protein
MIHGQQNIKYNLSVNIILTNPVYYESEIQFYSVWCVETASYVVSLELVIFFPLMAQLPLVDQDLIEASRSHSDTPHSVRLLWTSDQPDAESSTWQHKETYMPTVGFEPAIPASERSQTHDLDRAATGIGVVFLII